jgi:hypothetical protein
MSRLGGKLTARLGADCLYSLTCLEEFSEIGLPVYGVLGNPRGMEKAGDVSLRLFSLLFFLGFTLQSKFLDWLQSVFVVHLV